MNLSSLHTAQKPVSVAPLFRGTEVLSLKFEPDALLKEHITKIPAMLLCVEGSGVYEDQHGTKTEMRPGDYVSIEPEVKHWVKANQGSHFLLFR